MLSPYKVIIVDELLLLASLVKRVILRHYPDATVLIFANGQEALEAYDRSGATLLIVSQGTFRMNGPELVRILRARGDSVPVVGISADTMTPQLFCTVGVTTFICGFELLTGLLPTLERVLQ